jgi:hypothetical protein
MRGFDCHWYYIDENEKLKKSESTACWAGLNRGRPLQLHSYDGNKRVEIIIHKNYENVIFIDNFVDADISDTVRKRIVYLINKITPCSFVNIENKLLIKYNLLNNHYSDLFLLNLIRTMWYISKNFNLVQFHIDIQKKKPNNKDYLEFIMETISKNIIERNANNQYGYGDHSFVYEKIIPKKKDTLISYKGKSMQAFLQQKK